MNNQLDATITRWTDRNY